MNSPKVHALVPAAGRGERLPGTCPKQHLLLAGSTVLSHAARSVSAHPLIRSLTVVLAADDRWFKRSDVESQVPLQVVSGGPSRAHSVVNGLREIVQHDAGGWALVHDAARPCLDRDSLARLLQQGLEAPDGALLALPVRDTLKRADGEGRCLGTADRDGLWQAQTPQLFPAQRLLEALEAMLRKDLPATDEAAAIEYAGGRPLLVPGSPANFKLTWPGDLALAEAWLTRKAGHEELK